MHVRATQTISRSLMSAKDRARSLCQHLCFAPVRAHRCTDLSPLSVSDTVRHICADSPAAGHCLRLCSSDCLANESRRHEPADLCADNGVADDCVADCPADDRVADYRVANAVSDFVADCTADLQSLG